MASLALAKLINRKLIKISGPDCYPYLQSLFTNDLRCLYEPDKLKPRQHARVSSSVISSFMLNAQGRAICDIIVYRTPYTRYKCEFTPPGQAKEHDELLLECDSNLATALANTLYGYRVRRKVSFELLENCSVWCLFPKSIFRYDNNDQDANSEDLVLVDSREAIEAGYKETIGNDLTIVSDPRLDMLGWRILATDESHACNKEQFSKLRECLRLQSNINTDEASVKDYIAHRYRLGVGEGSKDHPEADCLPLECNADLLGSVSFDKGCYLGQELTARIHFTGVVRKRLMPIRIHKETKQNDTVPFADGTEVIDEMSGKKLGVMRHESRGRGLALLRHDLINDETRLVHAGTKAQITTWRPYWWQHDHSNK